MSSETPKPPQQKGQKLPQKVPTFRDQVKPSPSPKPPVRVIRVGAVAT